MTQGAVDSDIDTASDRRPPTPVNKPASVAPVEEASNMATLEDLLKLIGNWRIDPNDPKLKNFDFDRLDASVKKLKRRLWGATLHRFQDMMGKDFRADACRYLLGKEKAKTNPSDTAIKEIKKLLPERDTESKIIGGRTPDEVIKFLIDEWKSPEDLKD
ncbi:MAG: hypothetical protein LC768_07820 [Acidobacteria bacterium]|nr:hypothetical protein [Acidobacteriota bacterium]